MHPPQSLSSPSHPLPRRNSEQFLPPTSRSSFTFVDPADGARSPSKRNSTDIPTDLELDEIISRDEEAITRYGGNDPEDPAPGTPLSRTLSRHSTRTAGQAATHHNQKDPNLVDWDGPDDPANPQNWSKRYRWMITSMCIIISVNVTFASSAPSSTIGALIHEFGVSRTIADLVTTTFLLGYCLGPLFWGPGSELLGRRPIFVGSIVIYTLFILGQALAKNIETLMITRFLSGFFACAPLTIAGGIMADMWDANTRGLAVSLFSASVFLGPVLGPIISGFIAESSLSWRWVFWVMFIFAAACAVPTIPFFPETCAPVLLAKKARRMRKESPEHAQVYSEHDKQDWSMNGVLHRTIFRPFKMLAVEPILLLVTVYLSLVYGLLYALFSAFPVIFVSVRGFNLWQNGLIFIGVGIGTTLGSLLNVWTNSHYPHLIVKWKGFPPPEQRLFGAMIGSPALVVGAFWLGWTGNYPSVPWYVPGLATVVVGTGINLIFMSFLSYIVDTYLMYAASALAANTVIRSAVAAGFPLFTTQMFTNLGVNWACTLIGLLALLFAPSPFLFYKYGAKIREKSVFAPCIDLVIAKKMKEELAEKGAATA